MSKPKIRVAFVDIDSMDNYIIEILKKEYELIVDLNHPDFLFFSHSGLKHLQYQNCTKIYTTIESIIPDFNDCDYAISSRRIIFEDRHFYCPPALAYNGGKDIEQPLIPSSPLNREFCSFLYSSTHTKDSLMRRDFCIYLQEHYKHVDCPGKILHNINIPTLSERFNPDKWRTSKIQFLSNYKFNIAFENADIDGYITEKLMDCFLAGTVPIYYGSSKNIEPFPKNAMIYANDYPNFESLVARIREIDENDDLYLSILNANPLLHGMKADADDAILNFLRPILLRQKKAKHTEGLHSDTCTNSARLSILVQTRALARRACYLPAAAMWVFYKLASCVTRGAVRLNIAKKRQRYGMLLHLLKNTL